MSLTMGQIELEYPELFALKFGKVAESNFLYTPYLQILINLHRTWSNCM